MRMDSDGNVARSESFTDLADVLAGSNFSIRDTRPLNRSSLGGFVRSASESVDLAHLASSGSKPFGIGEFILSYLFLLTYCTLLFSVMTLCVSIVFWVGFNPNKSIVLQLGFIAKWIV